MIANADVKVPPLSHQGRDRARPRPEFEQQALPCLRELYPAALRLTRDNCDAEDLIQETFTRAYAKFSQFRPGTSIRAWLYQIMFATFCSDCRKRRCRPAELLTADLRGVPGPAPGSGPASSAETEALANLAAAPVMRALSDLPVAFKTAVYLADVHGYRYAEIAQLMGTPVGTVMSRIYRGRRMLRARLVAAGGRSGAPAAATARRAAAAHQAASAGQANTSRRAASGHTATGPPAAGPPASPSPVSGAPARAGHPDSLAA